MTEGRDHHNGPKGLFAAICAASAAVFGALSLAVWAERPIVGDGIVQFFDEHYYDLNTIRAITRAAIKASIVLGLAFAVALFGMLLSSRAYARAAFWALAIGGALLFTRVLKELLERPEIGTRQAEYSFPSGNAAVSVTGVAALVLLFPRLRRWIALAGVTLIPLYGLGLVMLLWHYPSDVVGGWALGLAWVSALGLTFRKRL